MKATRALLIMIVAICLLMSQNLVMGQSEAKAKAEAEAEAEAEANSASSSNLIVKRLPGGGYLVIPSPEHLQVAPTDLDQKFCWQKYAVTRLELERTYTLKEIDKSMGRTGVAFAGCGGLLSWLDPIKIKVIPSGFSKTDKIELKINLLPGDKKLANYTQLKDPVVVYTTSTKITQRELLKAGLRTCMEKMGADIAVLREENDGFNTVMQGKTIGLPLSVSSMRGDTIVAGGVGYGEASIERAWKPGVALIAYVLTNRSREIEKPKKTKQEVYILNIVGRGEVPFVKTKDGRYVELE